MRVLALVEGRVVEGLLGVRMPRRPAYEPALPFLERIKAMLFDGRTWTAMLYMLLMMPLGMGYFTVAVFGIVVPLALLLAPFAAAVRRRADRRGPALLGRALGRGPASRAWRCC